MLCQAVQAEVPGRNCRSVPREADALRTALEEMQDGEVIVFFYEKNTEPSLDLLARFGAKPATAIQPRRAVRYHRSGVTGTAILLIAQNSRPNAAVLLQN